MEYHLQTSRVDVGYAGPSRKPGTVLHCTFPTANYWTKDLAEPWLAFLDPLRTSLYEFLRASIPSTSFLDSSIRTTLFGKACPQETEWTTPYPLGPPPNDGWAQVTPHRPPPEDSLRKAATFHCSRTHPFHPCPSWPSGRTMKPRRPCQFEHLCTLLQDFKASMNQRHHKRSQPYQPSKTFTNSLTPLRIKASTDFTAKLHLPFPNALH